MKRRAALALTSDVSSRVRRTHAVSSETIAVLARSKSTSRKYVHDFYDDVMTTRTRAPPAHVHVHAHAHAHVHGGACRALSQQRRTSS